MASDHRGDVPAGKPKVAAAQGNAVVAHLPHPFDRRLEFQFRLGAETLGNIAHVDADHRPALLFAQRLEERVAPAHAALHRVQAGAAARLQVSLLPAGNHQGHLGLLGPTLENLPVHLDRVERRGAAIAGSRPPGDRRRLAFHGRRPGLAPCGFFSSSGSRRINSEPAFDVSTASGVTFGVVPGMGVRSTAEDGGVAGEVGGDSPAARVAPRPARRLPTATGCPAPADCLGDQPEESLGDWLAD